MEKMLNTIDANMLKNQTRVEYLNWLDKRISEIQIEYDIALAAFHPAGLLCDQQKLLSNGGKLKGYKEIRNYINTH